MKKMDIFLVVFFTCLLQQCLGQAPCPAGQYNDNNFCKSCARICQPGTDPYSSGECEDLCPKEYAASKNKPRIAEDPVNNVPANLATGYHVTDTNKGKNNNVTDSTTSTTADKDKKESNASNTNSTGTSSLRIWPITLIPVLSVCLVSCSAYIAWQRVKRCRERKLNNIKYGMAETTATIYEMEQRTANTTEIERPATATDEDDNATDHLIPGRQQQPNHTEWEANETHRSLPQTFTTGTKNQTQHASASGSKGSGTKNSVQQTFRSAQQVATTGIKNSARFISTSKGSGSKNSAQPASFNGSKNQTQPASASGSKGSGTKNSVQQAFQSAQQVATTGIKTSAQPISTSKGSGSENSAQPASFNGSKNQTQPVPASGLKASGSNNSAALVFQTGANNSAQQASPSDSNNSAQHASISGSKNSVQQASTSVSSNSARQASTSGSKNPAQRTPISGSKNSAHNTGVHDTEAGKPPFPRPTICQDYHVPIHSANSVCGVSTSSQASQTSKSDFIVCNLQSRNVNLQESSHEDHSLLQGKPITNPTDESGIQEMNEHGETTPKST